MKRLFALLSISALLCPCAFAKTDKYTGWPTAKLLSAQTKHWTSTTGQTTNGQVDDSGQIHATTTDSTWNYETYDVVLDDGKMQYFGEKTLWLRWQRDPDFIENSTVRFKLKGDNLTVIDADGHEFKMHLVKRRQD
jgi:hypothetical protein